MPFVSAHCVTLTEISILQYFKLLHENEVVNYTQALKLNISLNKPSEASKTELDESNALLLDFYEKLIDLINLSLSAKRQYLLSFTHEKEKYNALIKKAFEQLETAYRALIEEGHGDVLEYFLDGTKKFSTGRSSLFYLIITNINHNNQWGLTTILIEWIGALKITSQNKLEQDLLDFFEFLLLNDSGMPIASPNNPFIEFYINTMNPYELYHAYIKGKKHQSTLSILSKFSGRKEDFPDFLAELFKSPIGNMILEHKTHDEAIPSFEQHPSLQLITKFPTLEDSIPLFVVDFTKTYLTSHLLTSVFFDEQAKSFYLEIIELLIRHHFLITTKESIEELQTLSCLAVFTDKLRLSAINYMLIPSEELHFSSIRYNLIHKQTGLFNWLCKKRVSPDLIRLLIQGLDTLLSSKQIYSQYQYAPREFWFSVSRIFITENELDPVFIDIVGKHIFTVIEKLYLNHLEIIVNGIVGKFFSYQAFIEIVQANSLKKMSYVTNNPLKKHFTNNKAKQLLELSKCMEFLCMLPNQEESAEKSQLRFSKMIDFLQNEHPPKFLNFYFLNQNLAELLPIFKVILIKRLPMLTVNIQTCKNHKNINLLAQMVLKIAFILQMTEEQRASFETIFNFDQSDTNIRALELTLGFDRHEPEALLYVNLEEEDDCFALGHQTHEIDDEKSQAPSKAAFFKPAPKNQIAKELLPLPLLQLSAIIHQVFNQQLVLRGGAVMDLLSDAGVANINDYDPIVFNLELEAIHQNLVHHCFALSALSPEEFSELQVRVDLIKFLKYANKQNYSLKVLRLKDAIELKKACSRLPHIAEKIICTPALNGHIIGQGSRKALMIEQQGVKIDLINFTTQAKQFSDQIKAYQKSGDFEISSLHMILDLAQEHFIIDGAPQALLAAHQQCISIVDNKKDVFVEDPIRLFRLVKEMLKKPHFSLDAKLLKIIQETDFNALFAKCFQENLSLYRGRISIAFSKLFEHFAIRDVVAYIYRLGLFENIFALDYARLAEHFSVFDHLEHLTAYQKKLVFFEFIYAHLCHDYPDDAQRHLFSITHVVKQVSPTDKINMEYIESWVLGKDNSVFVNDEKLNEILIVFPNLKALSVVSSPCQ